MRIVTTCVFLLLALNINLSAQTSIFRTFVEPGAYSEGIRTIQLPDSTYLSVANTTGFNSINQIYLLRLDVSGNYLEDYAYPLPGLSRISDMMPAGNANIAFCGLSQGGTASGYDGLLAVVDSNRQMTLLRSYGGPDWDNFNSLASMPDGGYCLAGYTYSYGQGDADAWLVRTDSLGDTLWTFVYGSTEEDVLWDVEQAPWGLVACGSTVDTGSGISEILVMALDDNGDTIWVRRFGGPAGDIGYSLAVCSDSGIVVAGRTAGLPAIGNDGFLMKLDKNGNQLWIEIYLGSKEDEFRDVLVNSGDSIAVAGITTSFGAGREDFSLYLTRPNGSWYGGGSYGGPGHDYLHSISPSLDGGYILTGSSSSFGSNQQGMLIIKTDVYGITAASTLVMTTVNDIALSLPAPYPNPTSGLLSIPSGFERLTIFDLRGLKVMEWLSDPGKAIDISPLPPGIYLLQISNHKSTSVIKVVRQ